MAILTPSANIKFALNDPIQVHKAAASAVKKYSTVADKFLSGLDDKGRQALKQYANKRVTGQTTQELVDWLPGANFSQKLKHCTADISMYSINFSNQLR